MRFITGSPDALRSRAGRLSAAAARIRSRRETFQQVVRSTRAAGDNAAARAAATGVISGMTAALEVADQAEKAASILEALAQQLTDLEREAQRLYSHFGQPHHGTPEYAAYQLLGRPEQFTSAAEACRHDAARQLAATYHSASYYHDIWQEAYDAQLSHTVDALTGQVKADVTAFGELVTGKASIDVGYMLSHPKELSEALINRQLWDEDKAAWLAYTGAGVIAALVPGMGEARLAGSAGVTEARLAARLGSTAIEVSELDRVVRLIATADVRFPEGSLAAYDKAHNLHILSKHVGMSPTDLFDRAQNLRSKAASSFYDLETAERAIYQTVWKQSTPPIAIGNNRYIAEMAFDEPIGTVVDSTGSLASAMECNVVLEKLADGSFEIVTAYLK